MSTLPTRCRILAAPRSSSPELVNDVHAAMNATRVARVCAPRSTDEVAALLAATHADGESVAVCGGRHAMGGQQFASGALLIDMSEMDRVESVDADRGLVRAQAGVRWPELIRDSLALQGERPRWGIRQKQTGADRLSLGGAIAANVHGRGLDRPPFVADVESMTVVRADGTTVRCDRLTNPDLFALVCGGYGLFGIVTEATIRLAPRTKVVRRVRLIDADALVPEFESRLRAGCTFGDFQFAIDATSDEFLRRGVFSCYEPTPDATPIPVDQRRFRREDWLRLLELAHTDKSRGFRLYAEHYLATDGQVYWSDLHQLADYLDGYHAELDRRMGAVCPGTEMISELYVPRARLPAFLDDARTDLRDRRADVIYGTIRLIRRDDESYLAWARDDWACVVLNLHVPHTPRGIERARACFRSLIDIAVAHTGSYYLTYHRWATRDQALACHPRLPEFLRRKQAHDPRGVLASDWWRHHESLLEGAA
ncbi:MAG: FAD-binding oxidoreductase [Phycisphaerales bacterium]